jgi:mannosyl-3-phosphoglycerate phosphatase
VEVARLTGLSVEDAVMAKMREASEPIRWQDTAKSLKDFERRLDEHGLNLSRGGRFYHVTGRTCKATGVEWLKHRFDAAWPERHFISVGLGDGPNDIGMLEAVDIAVVIKPARGSPLKLATAKRVIYSELSGPRGWCRAMQQILGESLSG